MSLAQQTLKFVSELISDRSSVSGSAITGGLYTSLSCSALRIFRMSSQGQFFSFSVGVSGCIPRILVHLKWEYTTPSKEFSYKFSQSS